MGFYLESEYLGESVGEALNNLTDVGWYNVAWGYLDEIWSKDRILEAYLSTKDGSSDESSMTLRNLAEAGLVYLQFCYQVKEKVLCFGGVSPCPTTCSKSRKTATPKPKARGPARGTSAPKASKNTRSKAKASARSTSGRR